MKICVFGTYDPQNARTRSMLLGLHRVGANFVECRSRGSSWQNLINLYRQFREKAHDCQAVLVLFPGHKAVILAKLITRKPVILDMFVSVFNTVIEDRREHSARSLAALRAYCLDWLAVRFADQIIMDTLTHADYISRKFHVSLGKFKVVPMSVDDEIFKPINTLPAPVIRVGFYGTYIPLHGVEYILQAASMLKNHSEIKFTLLGTGQTLTEIQDLARRLGLDNVEFLAERRPLDQLPIFISQQDVLLGIFGKTSKAQLVVPTKLFEAIAMAKPVITAETPAIKEWFTDDVNVILVDSKNPENLANTLKQIVEGDLEIGLIGMAARELFIERFAPNIVGRLTLKILSETVYKQ